MAAQFAFQPIWVAAKRIKAVAYSNPFEVTRQDEPGPTRSGPSIRAVDEHVPMDGAISDYSDRNSAGYINLKVLLHQKLLDMINLAAIEKMPFETFRSEIGEIIGELLVEENKPLNANERSTLVDDILRRALFRKF